MSKKYKILKEISHPTFTVPIGSIFEKKGDGIDNAYVFNGWMVFHPSDVEGNKEWFEEVIDRIEVVDIYATAEGDRLRVLFNKEIRHEKIKAIKQAIEKVLNDEDDDKCYLDLAANYITQYRHDHTMTSYRIARDIFKIKQNVISKPSEL